MNCHRFDDILELYAAGEADAEAGAALERHASECPECRAGIEAARSRLRALEAGLGRFRAAEGFVERAMARVRAEAAREAEPGPAPEPLTSRFLRYAGYAAAAALFVLAGYSLLQRTPRARLVSGPVACAGPNARALDPGSALTVNDVLATAADPEAKACVELASGRMRAVLAPQTVVRITDPRGGAVAYVARGGLFWRVKSERGAPVVASPLLKVAASRGAMSLHVTPKPGYGRERRGFRGIVTLVAHEGEARALVPGGRAGVLSLRPGQVLTLRSDRRAVLVRPRPFEDVRRRLLSRLSQVQSRLAELQRLSEQVSFQFRSAPAERQPVLLQRVVEYQKAMQRIHTDHLELGQRLDLLKRYQDQGRRIFRFVLRAAPTSR